MPLIVTEHYPEKLGNTVTELDVSHACAVLGKTYFSMMTPKVKDAIKDVFGGKPDDVVLYGLEVFKTLFLIIYRHLYQTYFLTSHTFVWSRLPLICGNRKLMST